MKQFDVVTVGACIIDAYLTIHEANVHCRLNEKDCELCVRYGEKVQVDSCQFFLGGNACNVAVGLARLGFKSGVLAETGDDEFAQKIINGLTAEGVSLDLLTQTKGSPCSFAIGIQFKRERTLFVSHTKREHDFTFDEVSTSWVYLTSLGEEWKLAYRRTLDFVKNNEVKLAFNPGSPQFADGPENLLDVLRESYVLVVNKTEAQKIVKKEENDPHKLTVQIKDIGPKIVAITDGVNGSVATDGKQIYHIGSFPVNVVAKTGAGDAYATGFLAALMKGLQVTEAMRWGAVNAASVVGHLGAQSGLMKKEELETRLKEHPEVVARQI